MSEFVFDAYHLNFADRPFPVAKVASDPRIVGVILKFSQGVSYGDWAPQQAPAIRASRLALGGYHMLDGLSGSGAQQARYFLGKLKPQPGDIVPAMDFESSGRKTATIAQYRALGEEFIQTIHAAGFECKLYGHADVKAAWADWRASGADYWWQPGDQIHTDVGPRGPDLWQYGPYTSPPGYPTDPAGIGRSDMSVVLTALPLIGTKEDPLSLTQNQQDYLLGMLKFNKAEGPPADDAPDATKRGYEDAKARFNSAMTNPPASGSVHDHPMAGFPTRTGKAG
jgi:hypothetical protein